VNTTTTPTIVRQDRRRGGRRRRAGTEILELALCLPILLGVVFATVQFGYQLYVMHTIQAAAREGARAAIPPGATDADVSKAVDAVMATGGFKSGTDYAYAVTPSVDPGTGNTVTVTVTFKRDLTAMRPLSTSNGWDNKQTPAASVVMRKE
jgi:Flp pilus assembly protein TadG